MVLHRGRIAEMATGEGKTLVATLPLYLNALSGRGAHLVTVNDYLARRDAEWMGQLYNFLGLTVGCIQHDQSPDVRREQYAMDITYGTNSEFGFDYLRDNGMATTREQQVQRGYHYAIVDEVDSILIDEARTPLIISGPATISTHQYDKWKPLVEQLVRKQTMLVNRMASEANEAFEKGEVEQGGLLMFKVKLGQPRNKPLLRMMEDPDKRRAIDKAELSFYQDSQKEALFELKEELFFTIDEKSQEADLSEQGRSFMNPDDPNAFVLPDLISEFTDIDLDPSIPAEEKDKKKTERQQICDTQAERIHNISQLLRAYCLFEKDVQYVLEENKVVIVDEYTGRKMPGRRWSDGLHQAVEAKEGVQIDRETQTLATIQTGRQRHPDEPAGATRRRERSDLQNAPGKVQRRHQRNPRASPQSAAGAGRDSERGSVRVAQPNAETREDPAQRVEREVSHAGSGDCRARRAGGHGHNFHEHGRPWHGH
jgi:preprotein translocase subunit SecA